MAEKSDMGMEKRSNEQEESSVSHVHYETPWEANTISWGSSRHHSGGSTDSYRLAISSYRRDFENYVEVLDAYTSGEVVCRASWVHCYPPTKTLLPPKELRIDLVLTTADYLRMWSISDEGEGGGSSGAANATTTAKSASAAHSSHKYSKCVGNVKLVYVYDKAEMCSPVTSCDWCSDNLHKAATCSIDTTVSVVDLEYSTTESRIVAHDKDVYDVAYQSAFTFATCSADGSVRLFDVRCMERSDIIHESQNLTPLTRIAWNRQDSNYLCALGAESSEATVIDVRCHSMPLSTLSNTHPQWGKSNLNGMAWSPNLASNICTVCENGITRIWDMNSGAPVCEHLSHTPLNNAAWGQALGTDWIAVTCQKGVKVLRV